MKYYIVIKKKKRGCYEPGWKQLEENKEEIRKHVKSFLILPHAIVENILIGTIFL
jgi:hypothetical protein